MVDIGVPQVNFYSMLSGLGDTLQANAKLQQQQQVMQARKAAFSDFTALDPTSPDYGRQALTVAQKLGSVGDQDGALKFLGLAQAAADKAHQAQREAVTDQHWNQSFGLQQSNANKPVIKTVKDVNGNEQLVRLDSDGTNPTPVAVPGQTATPNNPFSSGKMTADQAKAATMVDRMNDANNVITKNENINDGTAGYYGGIAAANPTIRDSAFFNYFASPARQATVQAQRNFVNAILRVESGAAISEPEFNNAQRQYFPQPGDSKAVIEQKRQNRITAMRGMAREAGPLYKPPASLVPQQAQQNSAITQEQYNALPSGTPYTAPDGSQRIKR